MYPELMCSRMVVEAQPSYVAAGANLENCVFENAILTGEIQHCSFLVNNMPLFRGDFECHGHCM